MPGREPRAAALLDAPGRRDLRLAILAGAAGAALLVPQAFLLGHIVAGAFLGRAGLDALAPALFAAAALIVARAGLLWTSDVLAARASASTRATLRSRLVTGLLARSPGGSATERTGELAATIGEGIDGMDAYLRQYLPQVTLAAIVPFGIGATVLVVDPVSGLVLGVTWPLIPLFMYLVGGRARDRVRRRWQTLSRLSVRLLDALQGLATLKAFGRSRAETAAIALAGERFREVTMSLLRVAFVSALVLELVATLSTAIVAVGIGLRLIYGRLDLASGLAVLILTPEFYRPLRALGAAFHAGMSGRESGERVADLLEAAESAAGTATTDPVSRAVEGVAGRVAERSASVSVPASGPGTILSPARVTIRFDRVSYTYPGRHAPALREITFDLRPGETVALVGPSGAGKSTIARLLLRFADPDTGSIALTGSNAAHDGTGSPCEGSPADGSRRDTLAASPAPSAAASCSSSLTHLDPDRWREHLAWVPQRPHLFHGTILENLLVARPDATMDEVRDALRLAHAEAFVSARPDGVHATVGEHAARLSGGEAQRLALARAFLRDAPIVVLDEPTAQLDPETEQAIGDAIARLRRGRTVLLIAHRLTTVRDADRIVVLAGGRILEEGSHDALIAGHGRYAALVAASAGVAGAGPS